MVDVKFHVRVGSLVPGGAVMVLVVLKGLWSLMFDLR